MGTRRPATGGVLIRRPDTLAGPLAAEPLHIPSKHKKHRRTSRPPPTCGVPAHAGQAGKPAQARADVQEQSEDADAAQNQEDLAHSLPIAIDRRPAHLPSSLRISPRAHIRPTFLAPREKHHPRTGFCAERRRALFASALSGRARLTRRHSGAQSALWAAADIAEPRPSANTSATTPKTSRPIQHEPVRSEFGYPCIQVSNLV
jgi:hypothetical protein